jgi:uncharacterized protein (TIGR02391 family)
MSLVLGQRTVTGEDPNTSWRIAATNLVGQFEGLTNEISDAKKLRGAVVRTRLDCNSLFVLGDETLWVIGDRARGNLRTFFEEKPGYQLTADALLQASKLDIGFEDPFAISFRRSLLDVQKDERTREVRKIAEAWVDSEVRRVQSSRLQGESGDTAKSLDGFNLHPEVVKASGKLFLDGHYRQAVLDAFIALNNAVQAKSGRPDLDGTSLMQHVFAPKDSMLTVSDDKNEQLGALHLFTGAILGIRNPRAHTLDENDPKVIDETLELLAFASFLFRQLDRAHVEDSI